ncbi:MAG: hypothetical protein GDYSWBUE_001318 [Candidatus Fervidibacterota bacterium]
MRCPACGSEHRGGAVYCPFTSVRSPFRERLSPAVLIVIVLSAYAAKSCKQHFAPHDWQQRDKLSVIAVKPNTGDLAELERSVFNLVNNERKKRGLAELAWREDLAAAALSHSRNMAFRNFFSHVDPIEGDLGKRLRRKNLRVSIAAENIFCCCNFTDYEKIASECVRSWMNSRGHRKNILLTTVKFTGVGVAKSNDGKIYITQIYIAP